MNFLIISGARCGSSSLQKSISNYYNLKVIFEPFSPWGLQRKKFKMENVIVKTIFHQLKNQSPILGSLSNSYFDECFDFYSELIPKFDKVILLIRDNIIEHAESMAALYSGNYFDVKYVYNLNVDLNPIIKQLNTEKEYITKLSKKFNLPIDTYESIYYGNGLTDKSIQLDLNIIDNKNRLRQYNLQKKLV